MYRGINGIALATVPAGSTLRTGKSSGAWAEVTLEGWVPTRSLGPTQREGFDRIVTADDGESLRDGPNGRVIARLRKGVLLARVAERGGWVRVRRTGWVHRPRPPALASGPVESAALPQQPAAPAARPAPAQQPAAPPAPAKATRTSEAKPAAARAAAAPPPVATATTSPGDIAVEVAHDAPLYAQPNTGQVAALASGASGRVLGQSGEWVRVQLEGWVRESDLKPGSGGALVGVTASEVRANPDRYVGRTVEWRVQFISIQTADELRNELPAGQPFLLTRGPLPEPGFVYVVVGRDQLEQFKATPALQELVLRVTIKAARTRYLATPVVELVSVVSGLPGK
jgi:hypothetical protein